MKVFVLNSTKPLDHITAAVPLVDIKLNTQVFVDLLKNDFTYSSELVLCWVNKTGKFSLWSFKMMKQLFLPLMFMREITG